MEAVTAFVEGPLCFVILYGMLKQKPWRFTLQFAVSLAQFYGDVLYFATSWYDGMLTFVTIATPCAAETPPPWSLYIILGSMCNWPMANLIMSQLLTTYVNKRQSVAIYETCELIAIDCHK